MTEGVTECRVCGGAGRCVHLVSLLDSAARIMRSSVRNGGVNQRAVDLWLAEKQKFYRNHRKEMGHAP